MEGDNNKQTSKINAYRILSGVLFIALIGVVIIFIGRGTQETAIPDGYILLSEGMECTGYTPLGDTGRIFVKERGGQSIKLNFDFDEDVCLKNRYSFNLAGSWLLQDDRYYVTGSVLSGITNYTVSVDSKGKAVANERVDAPHDWLDNYSPLIAHGGGIYRSEYGNEILTNSIEAIVQNYNLGHRVFEIDFMVTTDKELAAVHSGFAKDEKNGWLSLSSEEWMSYKGWWTTTNLMADDIIRQLLTNTDMYVITDTKSNDILHFELLYQAAEKMDLSVMERIIPQIYEFDMYEDLKAIYDFPSIIFTTYLTTETPKDIISFTSDKEDIAMIAINGVEESDDNIESYLSGGKESGKRIYAFTINSYSEMSTLLRAGATGVYTDYLLPKDYDLYEEFS